MKRILTVIAIMLFVFNLSAQELTIIHLNDTHSHFEPVNSGQNKGQGGVIERAAFVDSVRLADGVDNVLLLHAGDFSQGTSYFTELGGNLEMQVLEALAYDAVCLGNHEFDNGLEELARRIKLLSVDAYGNRSVPVVCANYDFTNTPLENLVKPYTIVHKAGLKIGIIGLLTDLRLVSSESVYSRLKKLDNAEVANKWAKYLKEKESCDMVIALTHLGYSDEEYTDPQLVEATRNFDLVVGGHSHTFLETIKYANNLDNIPVPIVQAGCWGLRQGILHITELK